MRILIFNFEYPPLGGGGGVATQQIAQYLARRHEVHIVTSRPSRPYLAEMAKNTGGDSSFRVYRVPVMSRTETATASLLSLITFVPSALWLGWQLTGEYKFDVINAQFVIPSGIPAAIIARARSIPFVLSFIGGDVFDPSKGTSPHRYWLLRFLVRLVARQAVDCTAISNDTRARARKLHGVKQNITVTHLGIKPSSAILVPRSAIGLPDNLPLFITVGRLIARKGYLALLHLWPQVKDAGLVIVGDGPQKNELISTIAKLNLKKRVFLTGHVPEERKLQLLRVVDGYVSASMHEGFGLVFLEAMDAGLPIVAVNTGGQTDFLANGVNALLVEPNNDEALAAALNKMIGEADLRRRLGQNNRRAVGEFYLEKTTAKFAAILEKTAKGR